ncbi:MAG TPA: MFS transporter [Bacilli bacterium]|nr:MFS transporter [Bacilli bacterium]
MAHPQMNQPLDKKGVALFFSLPVLAWALYDLANTIFSMNVVSRYFPRLVTDTFGAEDLVFSIAVSLSMALVALLSPVLGVLIDVRGRKKPYVTGFTLVCLLATAAIGLIGSLLGTHSLILPILLALFVVANFTFNSSLIFYNAQLADISTRENMGRVSGWGVGLGYVGTIIGLLSIEPFVTGKVPGWLQSLLLLNPVEAGAKTGDYFNAFVPTALLFLIFSLPLFFFVKDRPQAVGATQERGSIWKIGYTRVWKTFKEARNYGGLFMFLLANFCFTDAINTVIAFMSIYAQDVMGLTDSQLTMFLLVATAFAVIGSFAIGFVTDRIGSKKTIYSVLALWVVALIIASTAASMPMFWVTGILIGIGMGSTWVSTRTMIIELSPPEKRGEFFGLFSLSGKVSAIIGPLVWGITTYLLRDYGTIGSRIAILTLLIFILLGAWLMRYVPDLSKDKKNTSL